jgi:hypothetical protein
VEGTAYRVSALRFGAVVASAVEEQRFAHDLQLVVRCELDHGDEPHPGTSPTVAMRFSWTSIGFPTVMPL